MPAPFRQECGEASGMEAFSFNCLQWIGKSFPIKVGLRSASKHEPVRRPAI